MLKKIKGYYQLGSFAKHPEVIHGFSGRQLGDMSSRGGKLAEENRRRFLDLLGLDQKNLVLMEQVHQNKVLVVGEKEKGQVLREVDGLAMREKGIIMGVKVADCLPVFFYEPKEKIIAVAHAGWKGVVIDVIPKTLEKMIALGGKPENILVGIGPHIGGCCFTAFPQRAKIFQKKFGNLPGMVYQEMDKLHLDIAVPAVFQLESAGIKRENIEVALACTSCQNQDFFSFRKEKTNQRMLGVICRE